MNTVIKSMYQDNIIYKKQVFFLYKKVNTKKIDAIVKIENVNDSNIEDCLTFNNKEYIDIFRKFLAKGDRGYYGYLDGECVHRTWVSVGISEIKLARGCKIKFPHKIAYINYCATAKKVRGKNIYPSVLNHICNQLEDEGIEDIYVAALVNKNAANRGVEKAGFEKIKRVVIIKIFGISFKKETNL